MSIKKQVGIDHQDVFEVIRRWELDKEEAMLSLSAFVDHGDVRRIISLRRATRKEVGSYVEDY